MLIKDLFPSPWLTNTLLEEAFVATKKLELGQQALPYGLGAWLQSHFDAHVLAKRSEAQLEEKFIGALLAHSHYFWIGAKTHEYTAHRIRP